ncbi:MAG TPA: beta-glucosidase, partial [Bacteroidetes bacterium]|nr:beta-glucosidase [Bacteroidota bacterium]
MKILAIIIIALTLLSSSCKDDNAIDNKPKEFTVDSVYVNSIYARNNSTIYNVDYQNQLIKIKFNKTVDTTKWDNSSLFIAGGVGTNYTHKFDNSSNYLYIEPVEQLNPLSNYRLFFEPGANLGGNFTERYSVTFKTQIDSTPKFPVISDEELLTLIQQQTFRYFWDYAHPVSGLARERLGSGDVVTSGGSGFGMMAILVGIERSFITREEGFERLNTIVNFLSNSKIDRFHGAFSHWINGTTGKAIAFSTKDDGADLVETAFLMQGLLAVKEYFKNGNAQEQAMCTAIQELYEGVEWSWFRKDNENVLYWHWSPNYGWEMNHQIRGWDEALIAYVLAAGSPTYPISKEVYDAGWARNGAYPMVNNKTFYGISLPLGNDYGGPLFYSHYSFLGLDPRNLSDQYANYWEQNVAHSLINRAYCIANPKNYFGYSADCWGLTASDIQDGYTASSPTNDRGVIAPTAAISAIPYTPEESLAALRFFYYVLGDRLWGEYGFYDAFN